MLQIAKGKFFSSDKCYETLHRGTFYTNYRVLSPTPIPISIGTFLPSTEMSGIGTLTYELLEKIEWSQPAPGVMISTGGYELIEDVATIVSFALNVICTTDPDLTRRLVGQNGNELNRQHSPSKYLSRVFDTRVITQPSDAILVADFIESLIGLERKYYEPVIRAIRRYVTATHRIADDTSLAYSLFIMSMESLVQTENASAAVWTDYDQQKRNRIEKALEDASSATTESVKQAVLDNEHVAISRRFREFVQSNITPSFFREESMNAVGAISRLDLPLLIRNAYSTRSVYVHLLQELPKLLESPFGFSEVAVIEEQPTLTFQGLARLARHVIFTFVEKSPKVESEQFDWHAALPNIVRLPLSPELWMSRPEGYTASTAGRWLENFLIQYSDALLQSPGAKVSDLTLVLDKIEGFSFADMKAKERRKVVALYHLFPFIGGPAYTRTRHDEIWGRFEKDFEEPNIEGVVLCLLHDNPIPWDLEQTSELHETYYRERRHKSAMMVGALLEAMFTLTLAEMFRAGGNEARARELIGFAVEAFPTLPTLRAFEAVLAVGEMQPISARNILLPSDLTIPRRSAI